MEQRRRNNLNDSGSFGWFFLGLFIPLAGFIVFLLWIDSRPKSAKFAGIGSLISTIFWIVIIGLLVFFGFSFTKSVQNNLDTPPQNSTIVSSTVVQSSTESSAIDSQVNQYDSSTPLPKSDVDTTNLNTPQIKAWVAAVMDVKYPVDTRTISFRIDVTRGDDGLAYASVVPSIQTDNLDRFRINSNGELEEDGYYLGTPGEWTVISKTYLDTSLVRPYVEH